LRKGVGVVGDKFCGEVLEFEVYALGDLEVEAEAGGGAVLEGQAEVEVVGSSPDEVKVNPQGADDLLPEVDSLHFQKLLADLVLAGLKLEGRVVLPLDRGVLT